MNLQKKTKSRLRLKTDDLKINSGNILIYAELVYMLFALLGQKFWVGFFAVSIIAAVVLIVTADNDSAFCFSMFIIPSIRIFDKIGVTYTVNLLLTLAVFVYFIKRHKIDRQFIFALVLAAYELLHIPLYNSLYALTANVIPLFGLYYGWSLNTSSTTLSREKIARHLSWGVIISSLIYFAVNTRYLSRILADIGRESLRFAAYSGDPNALALYALLALSLIISLKSINKHYITIILLSVIVILTFSKMGFLIWGINMITMLVVHFKDKKRVFLMILIPLIVIVTAVYLRTAVVDIFNAILYRFTRGKADVTVNTITSGRIGIIIAYLNFLLDNPVWLFFGCSMNYRFVAGNDHVSHSTYFDLLLSWGVLGTFVFALLVVLWIKSVKRGNPKRVSFRAALPAVTLALSFLSLSLLSASMFGFVLAAAFISLREDRNETVPQIP